MTKDLINIHTIQMVSSKNNVDVQFLLAVLKKNLKSLKHAAEIIKKHKNLVDEVLIDWRASYVRNISLRYMSGKKTQWNISG